MNRINAWNHVWYSASAKNFYFGTSLLKSQTNLPTPGQFSLPTSLRTPLWIFKPPPGELLKKCQNKTASCSINTETEIMCGRSVCSSEWAIHLIMLFLLWVFHFYRTRPIMWSSCFCTDARLMIHSLFGLGSINFQIKKMISNAFVRI